MNDATSSPGQWMTLDECGSSCGCKTTRTDEFAPGVAEWPEGLSRRDFLKLASAGIAAASLAGCTVPQEKIVPYTDQPEKLVPGRPLHFATTLRINGSPRGVVVTSNEGRPTHIAGNPKHPMSLGACDAWTTAALYDLYDPDRLKSPLHKGEPVAWETFVQQALAWNGDWAKSQGAGVAILLAPLVSPTQKRLLDELMKRFAQIRVFTHDPITQPERPNFVESLDLSQADVIFSLENNFLFDRPDSLALTRAFSRRRDSEDGRAWSRLYVAETCPTITGIKADHRFPVVPQEMELVAAALLGALQGAPVNTKNWPWLDAVTDDLKRAGRRALVLGGRALSDAAKGMIAKANELLGNDGASRRSQLFEATGDYSLAALAGEMKAGRVQELVVLEGNPVLTAPTDLDFDALLRKVPRSVHLTCAANETSEACTWVVNAAHDLEAWGDAAAFDGTMSIVQPLIAPLYEGKSAVELVSLLAGGVEQAGYDIVRSTWQQRGNLPANNFETAWHRWLREGVIDQPPAPPPVQGPISIAQPVVELPRSMPTGEPPDADKIWLGLRPSDTLWDGRHANNGWLMELADPVTKLTWDNALLMSPSAAKQLGVADDDVVALHAGDAKFEAPVLIVPGHADRCVTLPLGYGRTVCGSVGKNVGVNAYALRTSSNPWFRPLDKIEKTGKTYRFARTQLHSRIEGRDLVHVSRVGEGTPVINAASKNAQDAMPSLYAAWPTLGHRWAMSLDLNSCIGCNACVIACQSENNIPVVGKEQVYMGRAMQWIRVDRYHEGSLEEPRIHFQPVPCMQCENAPCEVVCPVAATQHDDEGLNVMVYNRCVGTRYCSNNCPYKVRRFNFLSYNADIPESQRLGLNPNVTVRSRGVMEKCTYCVQRIEEARISAERDNRPLRGEDIVTACQAACPAESIVFGDLSDPQSRVSKNREKPGHYALLGELDTRPRTTYLEKRINPNPALEPRSVQNAAPTPI